ncbi:hypothetical protein [Candidatus Hecatella orcuttiae]|nr:hypothetical protein [Candidatus Hecatella orcuttiae]
MKIAKAQWRRQALEETRVTNVREGEHPYPRAHALAAIAPISGD